MSKSLERGEGRLGMQCAVFKSNFSGVSCFLSFGIVLFYALRINEVPEDLILELINESFTNSMNMNCLWDSRSIYFLVLF